MAITAQDPKAGGIDPRFLSKTPAKPSFFNRKEVRAALYQIVLLVLLAAGFYMIITNAAENLRRQNIASGFNFINNTAGFDISQPWFGYENTSTYGNAFVVGL